MSEPFSQPIDASKHPDGVHRNQYGHPIIIMPWEVEQKKVKCTLCESHVFGFPYQRVTTFVGVLEDNFRITLWQKRNVALGLAMNGHLVLKVSGLINPNDLHERRDDLDKVVEEAELMAKAHVGADSGTALHQLTERFDRGEKAVVPEAYQPDINAYMKCCSEYGFTFDEIEVTIVIDRVYPNKTCYGISGRFDRTVILPYPCEHCGKRKRIFDLKTQKEMEWGQGKTAMQLTCYAHGKRYNSETGERTELNVCQCVGHVLHLPVGKGEADLYDVDLITAKEGLGRALQAWQWRQQKGLLKPTTLPKVNVASNGPDIFSLINMAADANSIRDLWRQFYGNGWAYGHEIAAKRKIAELEGSNNVESIS